MEYFLIALMTTGVFGAYAGHASVCFIIFFGVQLIKRGGYNLAVLQYPPIGYLAGFGVTYVLLSTISFSYISAYLLAPILAFLAGWTVMDLSKNNPNVSFKKMIVAMLIGLAVHAAFNALHNIDSSRNEIIDAFTGLVLSATCAGGVNTLSFSLLLYFILEKKKSIKGLGFACLLISVWYASILASRTQFLVILGVFVVMTLLYFAEQKNASAIIKFIIGVLTVSVIVYIFYTYDLFSLRTTIESSNIYQRLQGSQENSDEIRYTRFFEGIENLWKNPLGSPEHKYFHNMWLDIGRVVGIFPMLFMLAYNVITAYHAIKIFKNKTIDSTVRFIILSLYIGFLMNLFVEPAIEGMFDIVLTFMIVNGAVEWYFYSMSERNNAEVTIK